MSRCPDCGGAQWPDHPAGALTFDHSNECAIRRAEDATRHADRTRAGPRPATAAERTLLGVSPEADVRIHLTQITPSIIRRDAEIDEPEIDEPEIDEPEIDEPEEPQ